MHNGRVMHVRGTKRLTRSKDAAILQQAQMDRLESPRKTGIETLQGWLSHPNNTFLKRTEEKLWNSEHKEDFVALCHEEIVSETDHLTKWILGMTPWFHSFLGYRIKVGTA